jgi:hypothetical protein
MSLCEKYVILDREYFRYQFSILELCELVHSYSIGTIDCYEPLTPFVAFSYIKKREEKWRVCRSLFDEIVLNLIKETISEYEKSDYTPSEDDARRYIEKHPKCKVYINNRVKPEEIG